MTDLSPPSLRVLNVFDEWLPTTQNWILRLLSHTPETDLVVASPQFLRNEFYPPPFPYIEHPLRYDFTTGRGPLTRLTNYMKTWFLRRFPAYAARHAGPIDVVHAHFGGTGCRFQELPVRLGAAYVVSFYGADYSTPDRHPDYRKRYQDLFQRADRFVCEGHAGADRLATLGCPREKIRVVHLGVDLQAIPVQSRVKTTGQLDLVQIATWKEKKGHRYTLEAVQAAWPECPNLTLTLVGGDPDGLRQRLFEEHPDLAGDSRIRVLDRIDFSALHAFMKAYHGFIHPSCHAANGDCEGGAPIVLLDAQATGMPIISTRHCDITDEVADGKSGFLSDEKDTQGLVDSIRHLYRMGPDEYAVLADQAVEHVRSAYDVRTNGAQLAEVYREAASNRSMNR